MTANSAQNEVGLEVLALWHCVLDLTVGTFGARDFVLRALRLTSRKTARGTAFVVLPLDDRRSVAVAEAGDDIAPALVVVHTECEGNVIAGFVVLEAQNAGGAAAAHGEDVGVLGLIPGAAVGEVPHGSLDAAVRAIPGVSLEDANGDGVRHDAVMNYEI